MPLLWVFPTSKGKVALVHNPIKISNGRWVGINGLGASLLWRSWKERDVSVPLIRPKLAGGARKTKLPTLSQFLKAAEADFKATVKNLAGLIGESKKTVEHLRAFPVLQVVKPDMLLKLKEKVGSSMNADNLLAAIVIRVKEIALRQKIDVPERWESCMQRIWAIGRSVMVVVKTLPPPEANDKADAHSLGVFRKLAEYSERTSRRGTEGGGPETDGEETYCSISPWKRKGRSKGSPSTRSLTRARHNRERRDKSPKRIFTAPQTRTKAGETTASARGNHGTAKVAREARTP